MSHKQCCVCGKTSNEVRLYRDYADAGRLSDREIWCNRHVRADKDYVVPCVVDPAGQVWGLFSAPPSARPDFDRWWGLPEADPAGWTRPMGGPARA